MDAFHRLSQLSSTVKEHALSVWKSAAVQLTRCWQWLIPRRRMVFLVAGISATVALLIGFASAQGVPWQVGSGIAASLVIGAGLWWWVPKWQMRSVTTGDPKARADIEDNFRKTVGPCRGFVVVHRNNGVIQNDGHVGLLFAPCDNIDPIWPN
jgi:hypothetical protein